LKKYINSRLKRQAKIVLTLSAQLPWRTNIALMDKLENHEERLWYAMKAIENGWSQPILCFQIEAQAHQRQGKAINNFLKALPPTSSDMAKQIFKDPFFVDLYLGFSAFLCYIKHWHGFSFLVEIEFYTTLF
jgi:hypothetical protein